MTSIAVEARAGIEPLDAPLVVVAAENPDVRTRSVAALGGTALRVRGAASAAQVGPEPAAPDVLIIHCDEVTSGDLSVLRELKRTQDSLRIVVVCDAANGRSVRRAIDGGADGVVFLEQLATALAPTVAAVLAGQTSVPALLRTSVRKPPLSFREKQILGMVVTGLTNGQIGARLFLAESTVKSHLSSAFTKLGVRSRSEAAALILDPQESVGPAILATLGLLDREQTTSAD
ncbi:MAG TPA: response regulator transcription factor [Solirubrobacteraceae bacterium]|jgi:DNA-binding NarL/FixJ family response regulator|nr:response regulator transcription factor [Solirubrobacteraceae bacterium]